LIALMPAIRMGSYFLLPATRPSLGETTHTSADLLLYGCLLALLDGDAHFERFLVLLKSWIFPFSAGLFLLLFQPILEAHFHGAYKLTVGISLEAGLIAFIIAWLLRHPLSAG
jgi:hypothetical protein